MRREEISSLPGRYASAIYEIAKENAASEILYEELSFVLEILRDNIDLLELLINRQLSVKKKMLLIKNIFNGRVCDLTFYVIELLLERGKIEFLETILKKYLQLFYKLNNIIPIDLTVAAEINESDLTRLKLLLEGKFKKEIKFNVKIDADILGGFVIKIEDMLIDSSVKAYLGSMLKACFSDEEMIKNINVSEDGEEIS